MSPEPKNIDEMSFDELEDAAKHDNVEAMCRLGRLYNDGVGVEKDYGLAKTWYERAADKGNAKAMRFLGVMCHKGEGIKPDYGQAKAWYEKAADEGTGDTEAMLILGAMCHNGEGIKSDYGQARKWFEKAAMKDHAVAMYILGRLYLFGTGVKKDYGKAQEWFEKAADQGSWQSMLSLGLLYAHGVGVDKNPKIAFDWYRKASRKSSDSIIWCLPVIDAIEIQKTYKRVEAIPLLGVLRDQIGKLIRENFSPEQEFEKDATVTHFTQISVLRSILFFPPVKEKDQPTSERKGRTIETSILKNLLRVYNTMYANDPLEGQALINYARENGHPLANFFMPDDGCPKCLPRLSQLHSMVYSLSMTRDSDSLPLWRAYGRDGAGIGIEIPVSEFKGSFDGFEDGFSKVSMALSSEVKLSSDVVNREEQSAKPDREADHLVQSQMTLVRVIYGATNKVDDKSNDQDGKVTQGGEGLEEIGDKQTNQFVPIMYALKEPLEKLDQLMRKKNGEFKKGYKEIWPAIRESVQMILGPLLYLCKDEAYKEEHEYRVLVPSSIGAKWVELDEGFRDTNTQHTYIPTEPFLFMKEGYKIVIGPKVPDPKALAQELQYRLTKLGFDKYKVEIRESTIPYR